MGMGAERARGQRGRRGRRGETGGEGQRDRGTERMPVCVCASVRGRVPQRQRGQLPAKITGKHDKPQHPERASGHPPRPRLLHLHLVVPITTTTTPIIIIFIIIVSSSSSSSGSITTTTTTTPSYTPPRPAKRAPQPLAFLCSPIICGNEALNGAAQPHERHHGSTTVSSQSARASLAGRARNCTTTHPFA